MQASPSETPRPGSKRIHELDGLRFIAIAGVLLVHYRPPFRPHLDALALGWAGVDLFFVISGYLITSNLLALRGTSRPYRVFYWHRFLRIFPPYYLALVAVIALCVVHGDYLSHSAVGRLGLFLTSIVPWPVPTLYPWHAVATSLHHGLHSNALLPLDNHVMNNFVQGAALLWSLSIEELFYLVWAPVVLRGSRFVILAVSLSAIAFCPLLRILCHVPNYFEYFYLPTRFDALTFGSVVALLFTAHKRDQLSRRLLARIFKIAAVGSTAGLVVLGWQDGLFQHKEIRSALSFAAFGYTLLGVLFASVMGSCILESGNNSWWAKLLRLRALTYVGEISYVIYLTHIPVYISIGILSAKLMKRPEIFPTLWLGLIAAFATIALAALSWKFYERPLQRFRNAIRP